MDAAPGASGHVRGGGALLDIPSQAAIHLELEPSRINMRARSFRPAVLEAQTRKAQEIGLRLTRKEMRFFGFVPRAEGHRLPCCSSRHPPYSLGTPSREAGPRTAASWNVSAAMKKVAPGSPLRFGRLKPANHPRHTP